MYTGEALVIITALNHIQSLPEQNYYIISDSLNTILNINNVFNLNDISIHLINIT